MRLLSPLPIRAVGAAVMAVAGLALAPGKATASCGDYVHIRSDRAADHPPAAPCPCHGPGCSKAPVVPVIPMTAPSRPVAGSEQPVATAEARPPRIGSDWTLRPPASVQPVRLASVIFHPPRAG